MTVNLQMTPLVAAISEVAIVGLDILDFDEIPEQVDCRAKAQLFPDPEIFATELVLENKTYGMHIAAKDASYKLNYVLAYKQLEAGRRISDYIPGMVAMVELILETLTATDFSAYGANRFDMSVPFMGRILDPAGSAFLGARIVIDVLELIQ